MGVPRRQIKHVASLQHKLLTGLKVLQNFQGHVWLQAQVFLPTDLPAAATAGLQQKNVVAVEVRPHTPTGRGKGNHQIVKPGIRHKAELLQKIVCAPIMQIHTLHQQGPAGLGQRRQAAWAKRTLLHTPAAGLLLHQSRLHLRLAGQRKKFGAAKHRLQARYGAPHQQRLFLPVAAHELRRR